MSTFIYILLTTVLAISAQKPRKISNLEHVELGKCKPNVDQANKLSEEHFAKTEAKHFVLPNDEVLARLIYSEALSTGFWKRSCQAKSAESLMFAIGWGVMNRVDQKKNSVDAYYDVVFAKNQFRTSFSGKKENLFAVAFLCPERAQIYLNSVPDKPSATAIYRSAQEVAKKIIRRYETEGIPIQYKGITNFFYPYSEFFGEMRPSWAKNQDASKNKGFVNLLEVETKLCIEAYRL